MTHYINSIKLYASMGSDETGFLTLGHLTFTGVWVEEEQFKKDVWVFVFDNPALMLAYSDHHGHPSVLDDLDNDIDDIVEWQDQGNTNSYVGIYLSKVFSGVEGEYSPVCREAEDEYFNNLEQYTEYFDLSPDIILPGVWEETEFYSKDMWYFRLIDPLLLEDELVEHIKGIVVVHDLELANLTELEGIYSASNEEYIPVCSVAIEEYCAVEGWDMDYVSASGGMVSYNPPGEE